jgi:hypothetical protein
MAQLEIGKKLPPANGKLFLPFANWKKIPFWFFS